MQTPRNIPGRPSTVVPFTPRLHETPRIARNDEPILSARGSPINVLGTVRAKVGKRGRAPEVMLTLLGGEEMNLAEEETVACLDESSREDAVCKLLELQAQVEAHLLALQGGQLQEQPDE